MKKVITILMILILSLSLVVSAEGVEQGAEEIPPVSEANPYTLSPDPLKEYIEEKIIPVVVGVATSLIALIGTLKSVFDALKGLKESKETFDKEQASIKENSKKELEEIKQKYEEIKESIAEVPELLEKIDIQKNTIEKLEHYILISADILVLAYSANSELVRTGKANQMTRLLEQIKEKTDEAI